MYHLVTNTFTHLRARVARQQQPQPAPQLQLQQPSGPCDLLEYLEHTHLARVCATCGYDTTKALRMDYSNFTLDGGSNSATPALTWTQTIARYRVKACGHTRHAECLIWFVQGGGSIGAARTQNHDGCRSCQDILNCRCPDCRVL